MNCPFHLLNDPKGLPFFPRLTHAQARGPSSSCKPSIVQWRLNSPPAYSISNYFLWRESAEHTDNGSGRSSNARVTSLRRIIKARRISNFLLSRKEEKKKERKCIIIILERERERGGGLGRMETAKEARQQRQAPWSEIKVDRVTSTALCKICQTNSSPSLQLSHQRPAPRAAGRRKRSLRRRPPFICCCQW